MTVEASQVYALSQIKVDHTHPGGSVRPRITVEWTDSAGARQTIERYGLAGKLIITDLHAATLVGEASRQAYLVGFIRCHTLRREPE